METKSYILVCFLQYSYFLAVDNFGVLLFLSGKWDFKKMLYPADLASLEEVLVLFSKTEVENKICIEWTSQSPSLWEYSI